MLRIDVSSSSPSDLAFLIAKGFQVQHDNEPNRQCYLMPQPHHMTSGETVIAAEQRGFGKHGNLRSF